jgi:hypothetical protein
MIGREKLTDVESINIYLKNELTGTLLDGQQKFIEGENAFKK